MKTTDKELEILESILRSEYHDGREDDDKAGYYVFLFSVETDEIFGKALSGVVSSLVKKGLASVDVDEGDETIAITGKGLAVTAS